MSWLLELLPLGGVASFLSASSWYVSGVLFVAAIGAVIWFVPMPIKPWAVAAVCLAAGVIFGLVEHGNYLGEKNGRQADQIAAQKAIAAKVDEAKKASDAAIVARRAADEARDNVSITYVDRIIHDQVPSTSCPVPPAARDAARGVRQLLGSGPAGSPAAK